MREELRELVERAAALAVERKLSSECVAAEVGCALRTAAGHVFEGVNIDCACGIGFCAEHSAIAAMVTQGESHIRAIVAVGGDGRILPPCGRCREFILQVNRQNLNAEVIVGAERVLTLAELLPERWQERF